MAEAAAVKNGVKRRFHKIFTAPNKSSQLFSELEKEMQLFNVRPLLETCIIRLGIVAEASCLKLAMMLDVRLAISETAGETLRVI